MAAPWWLPLAAVSLAAASPRRLPAFGISDRGAWRLPPPGGCLPLAAVSPWRLPPPGASRRGGAHTPPPRAPPSSTRHPTRGRPATKEQHLPPEPRGERSRATAEPGGKAQAFYRSKRDLRKANAWGCEAERWIWGERQAAPITKRNPKP